MNGAVRAFVAGLVAVLAAFSSSAGSPIDDAKGWARRFSQNIRVAGPDGMVAAVCDGRDDAFSVLATNPVVVVRADRSLSLHDYLHGKKPTPWDKARLVTDYVMKPGVPGVVAASRLNVLAPFHFVSWNKGMGLEVTDYAIDGTEFAPFPTTKEFRSKEGGYKVKAGRYVLGRTTGGETWYMGREFGMFCPRGDGRPGTFCAPADIPAPRQGRAVAPGERLALSIAFGRVVGPGDLDALRALRAGDWGVVGGEIRRGETKDYRPLASPTWSGASDLSFVAHVATGEQGVDVDVRVTDDVKTADDGIHVVFADAAGERTLERFYPCEKAKVCFTWQELAAAGMARADGIRFNVCVVDRDRGDTVENWMGIADGVLGGRDPRLWPFVDLVRVETGFGPERAQLPTRDELRRRVDAIAAANAALRVAADDEYSLAFKAMADYFVEFMRRDLDAEGQVAVGHVRKAITDGYRHYMDERVLKNAIDLERLQRELAARQEALAAGKVAPLRTVKYPRGVRPVPSEGGFKVDGREILLIGPDTWTNVAGWENADIEWIAKTGFNLVNCFYIGGTNYADVVRRCETNGIYCAWGSAHATSHDLTAHDPLAVASADRQNAYRNGRGYWLGSLVPSNPSPAFVFQVSFPEQWDAKPPAGDGGGKFARMQAQLERNIAREIPQQDWLKRRFGLPTTVHYSTHYNIAGLDPLVVMADFERLWEIFDIVGFDGGFGLDGSEWAMDFPKGGFELDLARSIAPEKPVADNETHVIVDGVYREYSEKEIYLSNVLAFLMGLNASSIWEWANTRHTYGEYAFTRANTYHATLRAALDCRAHPEEIAAFRRTPNPPFRLFHSVASFGERDAYVRSLYDVYGKASFSGWAVRFITERDLERGDFKGVKTIVLPDARRVSDRVYAALERFVSGGGTLLFSAPTALTKDERGERRQTLTLPYRPVDYAALAPPPRDDAQAPYGVMWRTGRTADGRDLVFFANLSRERKRIELNGQWRFVFGTAQSTELDPLDVAVWERMK